MATNSPQKPIQSLILDTGPLITNAVSTSTLVNSAEELYTTPAIISEIRDEATRSRVQNTLVPFLNIRTPSPMSYDAVVAFSKKTGDFAVLSRQDLGVLALAYEIHCEKNGGPWDLREAPEQLPRKRPGGGKSTITEPQDAESAVESAVEGHDEPEEQEGFPIAEANEPIEEARVAAIANEGNAEKVGDLLSTDLSAIQSSTEAQTSKLKSQIDLSAQNHDSLKEQPISDPVHPHVSLGSQIEAITPTLADLSISTTTMLSHQVNSPSPPALPDSDSSSESDGGEWITPSNLSQRQAKDAGLPPTTATTPPPQLSVATMTIDFAMQNVLLQMNLHLLSTNMQRIKRIATKVLRCHACFHIVRDTTKQFCPRCGQPSLTRVSCSTNAKGEFRIHLAKNYQYNKRGDRFSVPKPIAGTANGKWSGQGGGKGGWGRDLVFAEDQKEYVRAGDRERREKKRDLMHEDYLPGILTGERGKGREGGRMKVGGGRDVNSRKRF